VKRRFERAHNKDQNNDSNVVYVLFAAWYGLKIAIWAFWFVMFKTGWAHMQPLTNESPQNEEGNELAPMP